MLKQIRNFLRAKWMLYLLAILFLVLPLIVSTCVKFAVSCTEHKELSIRDNLNKSDPTAAIEDAVAKQKFKRFCFPGLYTLDAIQDEAGAVRYVVRGNMFVGERDYDVALYLKEVSPESAFVLNGSSVASSLMVGYLFGSNQTNK